MAKIDLHVHTKYSEHPAEWFLQRLGAKESYTEPEHIYSTAKKRGMDFVAITDHNRIDGALLLKEKYPDEGIIGVESTVYFPEDGCKVHILFYGIDEHRLEDIQRLRENIYELRAYIKEQGLAYSIAHATYSVNKKLTPEHVEKLLLMFDVFEGINGGRNYLSNQKFMETARRLTPEHIERLQERYRLDPISDSPWQKAFTAGSDDHSGLFAGKTYTIVEAAYPDDVINSIRSLKTSPMGRHNDYKSLAFTVYKIAYDFSKTKQQNIPRSIPGRITENIFESSSLSLSDKVKLHNLKSISRKHDNVIGQSIVELIEELQKINPLEVDERLDKVYDRIADITDAYFKKTLESLEKDIIKGDVINVIMNFSSSIPGFFMSLPFFSALKHMYSSRTLIQQLKKRLDIPQEKMAKKILWFTDSLDDLDGISGNFKEPGWVSSRTDNKIRWITASGSGEHRRELSPSVIHLPTFYESSLKNENIRFCVPSILRSLKIIDNEEPTEIFISSFGPVGLMGLLLARLFNIKCTGIIQTDLVLGMKRFFDNPDLIGLFEAYLKWFYSMMDSIKVETPTAVRMP